MNTADRMICDVARAYCVTPAALRSRDRHGHLTEPRAAVVYRLWSETDMTLQAIGDELGGRNYSTIIYLRDRHRLRENVA